MKRWEYTTSLDRSQRAAILALLAEQEVGLGREALDENRRRSIQHGSVGNYWLCYENAALVNIAVIERGPHSPTVELAGGGFDEQLFDSMTHAGSTNTLWWMRDGNVPSVPFQPVRRLRYLEARIDTIAHPPPHDGVRGFIAGSDDTAWLVANNAAFEDHPEQGRWELTELHERLAEQWFDPSGFLVLSEGGQIAASCWTKIHELPVVRTGEIYVIFVAPEFRGRGYGELMLQHGLAIIRSKGVSIASLYVEDSNDAAIALYTKYGFTTKRLDELVSISR